MVRTYQIEGGGGTTVKKPTTTTTYRPKSRGDTVGTGTTGYTKPTSPALPPTRTATQDWTVTAQRPDRPVTSAPGPVADYNDPWSDRWTGGGGVTTPPVAPPPPGTPPPPTGPEGPGGAGGDAAAGLLDQFTGQEIESALAALEAQYGMTREQLLQDQSLIGAQYRLLMTRLNRSRAQGIEGATNDAVSRGIYRSGIHGENIQEVENQFNEQVRSQEEQRLIQDQSIQQRLDFLEAEKAAQAAQIESGLRRDQANYYMQAGVSPPAGAGIGGGFAPQGGAPAAPQGPIQMPAIPGGGGMPAQQGPQGQWGTQPISQPNMGAQPLLQQGNMQGIPPEYLQLLLQQQGR